MNCNEVRSRLLNLTAPPPAGEPLADHLESCDSCGAYAARLAHTVRALADHHAGVEPDAAFAARVVAALPERNGVLGRVALKLLPAALALVLVLSGWIVIEQRRHTVTEEAVPTDDLLTWILQTEENGS
jgi:hypothetical protein